MTARAKPDSAPPVLHRGVGRPTKCRSCGKEIEFAHTTAGKVAPFEKDDDGNWRRAYGAGVVSRSP